MSKLYTPSNEQPNSKSFYEFARLNNVQKTAELVNFGVLLDKDNESDKATNLYYLHGFFVEEVISILHNTIVDIIPYKHGYKLESYAAQYPQILPKRHQP